uniref:Diguanylate cyclase n=1 Tax=Macrostomum lignano TaxID=282301 RepID=A0A1I8GAA6_9PLAT
MAILGLVLSAMASNVLGSLWYSPMLFGTPWCLLVHKCQPCQLKLSTSSAVTVYGLTTAGNLTTLVLLRLAISQFVANWQQLFCLASAAFALIVGNQLPHYLFQSSPLPLYWINFGYDAAVIFIGCVLMFAVPI